MHNKDSRTPASWEPSCPEAPSCRQIILTLYAALKPRVALVAGEGRVGRGPFEVFKFKFSERARAK
jgi:hypothetical protein